MGVVVLVFFLFQGFGDPSRLVMGQTGDSATQANIRKELYLDQPKWKQFVYYLNDVSPVAFIPEKKLKEKNSKESSLGDKTKFGFKFPYLRHLIKAKEEVW